MPGPTNNPGFTGVVQSGGPGNTYQVLLNNGQTVTVTQMQIDSTEQIPAGTPAIVIQIGSAYYMQVNVWLSG